MWPNLHETADLVLFPQEIINGEIHFLRNVVDNLMERCTRDPDKIWIDSSNGKNNQKNSGNAYFTRVQ